MGGSGGSETAGKRELRSALEPPASIINSGHWFEAQVAGGLNGGWVGSHGSGHS